MTEVIKMTEEKAKNQIKIERKMEHPNKERLEGRIEKLWFLSATIFGISASISPREFEIKRQCAAHRDFGLFRTIHLWERDYRNKLEGLHYSVVDYVGPEKEDPRPYLLENSEDGKDRITYLGPCTDTIMTLPQGLIYTVNGGEIDKKEMGRIKAEYQRLMKNSMMPW